jgi:hypothetical protein
MGGVPLFFFAWSQRNPGAGGQAIPVKQTEKNGKGTLSRWFGAKPKFGKREKTASRAG